MVTTQWSPDSYESLTTRCHELMRDAQKITILQQANLLNILILDRKMFIAAMKIMALLFKYSQKIQWKTGKAFKTREDKMHLWQAYSQKEAVKLKYKKVELSEFL